MPMQKRFGEGFIGRLWSMAEQDELPFAAVQRAAADVPFPDVFADFAARCTTWDFEPHAALGARLRQGVDDFGGWSRFVGVRKQEDGTLRPTDRCTCPVHKPSHADGTICACLCARCSSVGKSPKLSVSRIVDLGELGGNDKNCTKQLLASCGGHRTTCLPAGLASLACFVGLTGAVACRSSLLCRGTRGNSRPLLI